MFRFYLTYFLLFGILLSCSEKSIDCKRFKTGKFVYHNRFVDQDIIITKIDSIQTNVDEETGLGSKFRIEWIGSCEYKLTFLSLIVNGKDSVVEKPDYPSSKTKILQGATNYFISETKIEKEHGIHRDTIWVLAQ